MFFVQPYSNMGQTRIVVRLQSLIDIRSLNTLFKDPIYLFHKGFKHAQSVLGFEIGKTTVYVIRSRQSEFLLRFLHWFDLCFK